LRLQDRNADAVYIPNEAPVGPVGLANIDTDSCMDCFRILGAGRLSADIALHPDDHPPAAAFGPIIIITIITTTEYRQQCCLYHHP
jgi:hypothetical protein